MVYSISLTFPFKKKKKMVHLFFLIVTLMQAIYYATKIKEPNLFFLFIYLFLLNEL